MGRLDKMRMRRLLLATVFCPLFSFSMAADMSSAAVGQCTAKQGRACGEGSQISGCRLISLEAFAHREARDFTSEGLRYVKDAGFNGVFLNGGSGFGPDQIPLELACETEAIPGLAPYTCRANSKELQARRALVDAEGLNAWWCLWGVVGPYERSLATTYNDYGNFDRRVKLEMKAERLRHPEAPDEMFSLTECPFKL